MSTGIYKITNKINDKCYIGKAKNIERRWSEHIYQAKKDSNRALCKALKKYGSENFIFEIIEEMSQKDYDSNFSSEREKYWIKHFESFGKKGYNMTEGGDGGHPKGIYIGGFGNQALATKQEVIEIRTAYKNMQPRYQVYERYKDHISWKAFEKIWLNISWKGIMSEVYTEENAEKHKHTKKPSNKNNTKLTVKQVKEIRQKYKPKIYPQTRLAKEYNVSVNTIYKIVNYKTWIDI